MTTKRSDKQLNDQLKAQIEQLEETENPIEDIEPLDVNLEIGLDGQLREITLTLTTGGPHVTLELFNSVLRGSWGSSQLSRSVDESLDPEAKKAVETMADYYSQHATHLGIEVKN